MWTRTTQGSPIYCPSPNPFSSLFSPTAPLWQGALDYKQPGPMHCLSVLLIKLGWSSAHKLHYSGNAHAEYTPARLACLKPGLSSRFDTELNWTECRVTRRAEHVWSSCVQYVGEEEQLGRFWSGGRVNLQLASVIRFENETSSKRVAEATGRYLLAANLDRTFIRAGGENGGWSSQLIPAPRRGAQLHLARDPTVKYWHLNHI